MFYTNFSAYPSMTECTVERNIATGSDMLHVVPNEGQTIKITFNKNTHVRRWDKEGETEHEVSLFIEPKTLGATP